MHGLYLLWWVQEKEMSPAVVAAILAAGDLTLMCLELPTGWFADRVGHRASLICGSCVQTLAIVWCWLGDGFISLAGASVLVALGDAFRSGADEALLYRTCRALGREEQFQRLEARASAVALVALVGLVLAGGFIVRTWGFAAGWIAETILCALGVVLACAMVEPPDAGPGAADDERRPRAGFLSWRIAWLVVPAAIVGAVGSATDFFTQVGGGDPAGMTMFVATVTLAEAAGAGVAAWLPPGGIRSQMLLLMVSGLVCAVAVVWPATLVAVVVVLAFLQGVAGPLRAAAVQRLAAADARARAASFANTCDMAFLTVALPLAGWWRR
jgi:MFS family permease